MVVDGNEDSYTYDVLYQFINVDYNDGNSTSYTYDALGNRTDVNDGTSTAYVSNSLNQYTSVGGTSYTYDNSGNLTDDGTYTYYYDCENRLTDVNDGSGEVASYKYDYLGRRIAKIVDGNTVEFCYDGAQVIAEYENDVLVRKFVYGPGIDEPICIIDVTDSNAVYYYHFDGLGSVVALSDANSDIVETYSYDVFGQPSSTSSVGNPYLFTGRRYDAEAGLYYYRARYYAYDIGRFLQTDPIRYRAGLNLYTYVGNNPLNWIDPYGLLFGPGPSTLPNIWGGTPGTPPTPRGRSKPREPSPGERRRAAAAEDAKTIVLSAIEVATLPTWSGGVLTPTTMDPERKSDYGGPYWRNRPYPAHPNDLEKQPADANKPGQDKSKKSKGSNK